MYNVQILAHYNLKQLNKTLEPCFRIRENLELRKFKFFYFRQDTLTASKLL